MRARRPIVAYGRRMRVWSAFNAQSSCFPGSPFEPTRPAAAGPLGHAHACAGHQAEARKILQDLLELAGRRRVDAYCVALIYVALGQQDQAIEWLDTACNSHGVWFTYMVNGDPRLDALRSDPRLEKLVQHLGPA